VRLELLNNFLRVGYRQVKKNIKLLLGYSVITPALGSVTLDQDDVKIAKRQLKNHKNWFDLAVVQKYESAFAKWNGSKYAFAFMGGRVALSSAIYALGLEPGDEVIIPGYTCVVVPNAFHYAGVQTIYSDIELDTYGLDATGVESKITPRTTAILLHHLYGIVCRDYERLIEIAKNHGLYVIEDCAQSTGAEYKGQKIGNRGDIAIYSSEQSKVFTTIQGGIVATNNSMIAKRLESYKNSANYPDSKVINKLLYSVIINYYSFKDPGRWWKGDWIRFWYKDKIIISTTKKEEMGVRPAHYGCKMPSPIAAIGLNQLKKIDQYNELRRQTAKKWDKWCDQNGYKKPYIVPGSLPVYLRYPVLVEAEKKSSTEWAHKELGISLGVWFVSNIHPASWRVNGCPNANRAVRECINFPGVYL